jgi:multicomponent Na+:H+ antiporter subunit E
MTFLVSMATWIVLSGRFDSFHLLIGSGACAVIAFYTCDFLFPNARPGSLPGDWWRFVKYIPWLLYQVLIANLHVMYLVFHPRMLELIDPQIIRFESGLKNHMSLFIFANSITLTPGTITVYVSVNGEFTVHVIDKYSGTSLPGEMERRVGAIIGE